MESQHTHSLQRPALHPLLRLPFHLYKWLVVIPFLLLSTLIIGSLIILFSFLGLADFSSRVFGTLWARLNMLFTLMTIDIAGQDKITRQRSYVIVANHQSLLDIYVLYGYLGMDIKWVMKKELRAIPVLGLACQAMGHIIIDRSNTESALTTINSARDRFKNGMCVVFFPEGTRSRDRSPKQFKKGAFRLAIELGLPILPVSIHDTARILPSDTLDWFPGSVRLAFHDPIETTTLEISDVNRLTQQTEDIIRRAVMAPEL